MLNPGKLEFTSGMILYHLNKTTPHPWGGSVFELGKTYSIGKSDNPFYNYFFQTRGLHPSFEQNENPFKFWDRLHTSLNSGTCQVPLDIFKYAWNEIRYHTVLSRELVYEKVRSEINKKLPSRTKCLFMASEEDAIHWKGPIGDNPPTQLLKCQVKGKVVKVDSEFISIHNNNSLEQWVESAKQYWSGESTPLPLWECLVEGNVTILERVMN